MITQGLKLTPISWRVMVGKREIGELLKCSQKANGGNHYLFRRTVYCRYFKRKEDFIAWLKANNELRLL